MIEVETWKFPTSDRVMSRTVKVTTFSSTSIEHLKITKPLIIIVFQFKEDLTLTHGIGEGAFLILPDKFRAKFALKTAINFALITGKCRSL